MGLNLALQVNNRFSVRGTATGGTAFAIAIPPSPGAVGGPSFLYKVGPNYQANWLGQGIQAAPMLGIPIVTSLFGLDGATQHVVWLNRPLNFTWFPSGLAKNTTAIPNGSGVGSTGLFDDPGVYSTNYKYPLPGYGPNSSGNYVNTVFPGLVADAAISSTNKYVLYQLADGTWQLDTIASGTFGSSLTLTTGTPNAAGGAILAGAPLFYFGTATGSLSDPATGTTHPAVDTKASAQDNFQDYSGAGIVAGLHPGDPLLIYDANGTNQEYLMAAGYYGGW
jgi:hypothetical protein